MPADIAYQKPTAAVSEVRNWIRQGQFVTLLGPGGIDKTTVAVAAPSAARIAPSKRITVVATRAVERRMQHADVETTGVTHRPAMTFEQAARRGWSAWCQQETHAPQQTASLSIISPARATNAAGISRPRAIETANVKPHLTLRATIGIRQRCH
jgi:energy-coupling factor transporter ATP-binding protein EcfA2